MILFLTILFLFLVSSLKRGVNGTGRDGSAMPNVVVDCSTWEPPRYQPGSSQRWGFTQGGTFGVICDEGDGAWSIFRVDPSTGVPIRRGQGSETLMAAPVGSSGNVWVESSPGASSNGETEDDRTLRERLRDLWDRQQDDFMEAFEEGLE